MYVEKVLTYLHLFEWRINFPFLYSVVFWFGDLNFRIDDLDMQVVKSAIDNNKYPMLWEKDQVKITASLYH